MQKRFAEIPLPKEWTAQTRWEWWNKVLIQRFKDHTNTDVFYYCLYAGGPVRRRHQRRDWLTMKGQVLRGINA